MPQIRKRYRITLNIEVEAPAMHCDRSGKPLAEQPSLPEALAADPEALEHWLRGKAIRYVRSIVASEKLEPMLGIPPVAEKEPEEFRDVSSGIGMCGTITELPPEDT